MTKNKKNISTLVQDMHEVLACKGKWEEANAKALAKRVDALSMVRFGPKENDPLRRSGLRMSSIGQPCTRKLWYENNLKGLVPKEQDPSLTFKFFYGDLLEEVVLEIIEASGHKVEGHQDTMSIEGIKGHRDCVIDGVTVDIKTASSYSFNKFKDHRLEYDDPFGYLIQLGSYVYAAKDDPKVTDKKGGAFLAVDKQHGTIVLDYYDFEAMGLYDDIPKLYQNRKELILKEEAPSRPFPPEPDGKSGNLKLQQNCVYCPFNRECYPSLRVFQGKGYQKHLVKINREPLLQEVT